MGRVIVFVLMALAIAVPVCATTIHVPADQPTIQAGRGDAPDFLWTRTMGTSYVDDGVMAFETKDSSILVLARSFTDTGGPDDWMIILLTASGDTVWTSRLGDPNEMDRPKDALELGPGKYVVCGTSHMFGGESSVLTVAALDSTGHLDSKMTFDSTASLWALCAAGEDRFMGVGKSGSRGLIAMMRYPLDTVWTMQLGEGPQETVFLNGITQAGGGTYLACGYYHNSSTLESKGFAACFDTCKVVKWTKKFGGGAASCTQLQNGLLAVAGADSVARVWLFDSTGTALDSISFPDTLPFGIADICKTIDGGFIVAGISRSYDSKLVMCDRDYQPVWAKSFDLGYEECQVKSVQQTSDGGFVICGTVNNSGTQPDILVCRTASEYPYVTGFGYWPGSDPFHLTSDSPVFQWTGHFPESSSQTACDISIGTDSTWINPAVWHSSPPASSDTFVVYDGAPLTDGQTYYVRMCICNDLLWSPWFHSSFRMNTKPGIPVPIHPAYGGTTNGLVTLWLQNAVDPEGDPLTYDFTGFHDTDCVACPPLDRTGVPQGVDSTGTFYDLTSAENHFYFWWARAYDGFEYGDWCPHSFFTVSAAPEAPTAPGLIYPVDPVHGVLYDLKPEFLWSYSYDPDPGDTVRYRLEVAVDSGFTFVRTVDSLMTNRYTLPDSLRFDEQYWWRVKAFDKYGLTTPSAAKSYWTWTLGDLDYTHLVTMGDLTVLIDHLFITLTPLDPMKAGDLDGDCLVTMSDLTIMIDHLFITLSPLTVPGCE